MNTPNSDEQNDLAEPADVVMRGVYPTEYQVYEDGDWKPVGGTVTEEAQVCLFVNGRELATVMCTPYNLDELALGFLRAEGIIQGLDDIEVLTISEGDTCVDVWLNKDIPFEPPKRRIITSGCSGGLTFDDLQAQRAPLTSTITFQPDQLFARMRDLYQSAPLYEAAQGIHAAALADERQLLITTEDIGRHNAVDRVWGRAIKQNLATADRMLLSTGRISSEMLNKAAKMGVPVVGSRTSPTSLSVKLARAWNITLIGYMRRKTLRVYSAPERIAPLPPTGSK